MGRFGRYGIIAAVLFAACAVFVLARPATSASVIDKSALEEIEPDADSFTQKSIDGRVYFEAKKGYVLIGYCLKATGSGYGGPIEMAVAIDPAGTIKRVKVLDHYESPGFGAKIFEVHPGEKEPYFLRQFSGKKAESVEIGKNIDAVTGATISSTAVTDGIRETVKGFLSKIRRTV